MPLKAKLTTRRSSPDGMNHPIYLQEETKVVVELDREVWLAALPTGNVAKLAPHLEEVAMTDAAHVSTMIAVLDGMTIGIPTGLEISITDDETTEPVAVAAARRNVVSLA